MAAYKTEQINVGSIAAPDVGRALTDYASMVNANYQQGLSNTRNAIADQRAKELFDRQTNEYNREVAGRQALQDYAAQPVQTDTMIDSQRKLMDEAVTDRVNKLGRAFTPEEATRIQKAYESITPFREDVETKIEKDLIAKNVDPLKAKQYAQMEGAKYQSIPEYQQFLNTQAEKATANEQNRFKDTLELEKFKREAYKDELDKYKTKMEMLYKGMGAAGGTTGGGTGGIIGGQDKSKAYEKAYTKAGNEEELAKRLDAAFTKYGARAVNNALAASGIDEPVRLLEWDVGRRDVSLDRFDKALANEKPLSAIQGQFNSGIPEAPTYGLPGVARVYTPESARSVAQTSAKDRLMQVLGGSESAPTPSSTSPQTTSSSTSSAPGTGNTLADKNNNPGNLVTTRDNWLGKIGDDGKFVRFQTYELGSRALAKNLYNGAVGNSIESYMNKYAPKSENDTDAYIKQVSKALGKNPNEKITDSDVFPLMKIIAKQEGGKVDEDKLKLGYDMASLSKNITPAMEQKNIQTNRDALLTQTPDGLKVNESGNIIRNTVFNADAKNQVPATPESDSLIERIRQDNPNAPLVKYADILSGKNQGPTTEESNYLIADRNYRALTNMPESTKIGGKTRDEWNLERSSTNRIGDVAGPMAPIVAASAPLVSLLPALADAPVAFTTSNVGKNAIEKTTELMSTLRSPHINAGQVQQTKDSLLAIANKYPELRTDIVKFIQNLR